jgi:hypothetical protein
MPPSRSPAALARDMSNKWNCNAVRREVTRFLATKEMKQTAWLAMLGVNYNTFRKFMAYSLPMQGSGSHMYSDAGVWLMQRLERLAAEKKDAKAAKTAAKEAEKAGKKTPVAKRGRGEDDGSAAGEKKGRKEPAAATITGNAALDAKLAVVKQTMLPEEGYDAAALASAANASRCVPSLVPCVFYKALLGQQCPVYDMCEEVRANLDELKDSTGATTAAMCNALGFSRVYGKGAKAIAAGSWTKFMRATSGDFDGCQQEVYYLGYVFFEKLRIAAGGARSPNRLSCERSSRSSWGLPRMECRYEWVQR